MTLKQIAIAAGALLVVVLLAVLAFRSRSGPGSRERTAEGESPQVEAERDPGELLLYFPGPGGWLVAEEREVETDGEPADLQTVAAEVLAGPTSARLFAPFPGDTRVGSVFVSEGGIAYVDLVSTQADPPRSGSRQEMLSVFSLVNSVHSNLPELTGVVLLWNGQQRPTFAGHLDTGRPLEENSGLVARGSRGAAPEPTPAGPTDPSRP